MTGNSIVSPSGIPPSGATDLPPHSPSERLSSLVRNLATRFRIAFIDKTDPLSEALIADGNDWIAQHLQDVRRTLNMDVGFICEIRQDLRHFRHVDMKEPVSSLIREGNTMPLSKGYCARILDGRLPLIMTDTAQSAEAMAVNAETGVDIRSYISMPIRTLHNQLYGTCSCFSYKPDPTLNDRDLASFKIFAEQIGFWLMWSAQIFPISTKAEPSRIKYTQGKDEAASKTLRRA